MTTSRRFGLSAALAAVLVATATADILVTKMGKKYEGQVIEQDGKYVITTPKGARMTFPKEAVREVVTAEAQRQEYEARKAKATTPEAKWVLAAWCDENGMKDWSREQRLAAIDAAREAKDLKLLDGFLEKLKGKDAPAEVRASCVRAIGRARRAAIEALPFGANKATRTWELAEWHRQMGLPEGFAEHAQAAIGFAREAKDVPTLERFLQALDLEMKDAPAALKVSCAQAEYEVRREQIASMKTDAEKAPYLEGLALFCRSQQLEQGRLELLRELHAIRRKSADAVVGDTNRAMALAELAAWCSAQGLQAEAQAAEQEALKLTPDDAGVREKLNYVKDPATGRWVKGSWKLRVLSAQLMSEYTEELMAGHTKMTIKPADGKVWAHVKVEFEARSPSADAASQWRSFVQGVPGAARSRIEEITRDTGPGPRAGLQLSLSDFQTPPARDYRLFRAGDCHLALADGTQSTVSHTSKPEGSGITLASGFTERTTTQGDRAVVRYLRIGALTALLVQPRRPVTLELLFPVPRGVGRANLHFGDGPPLPVTFQN